VTPLHVLSVGANIPHTHEFPEVLPIPTQKLRSTVMMEVKSVMTIMHTLSDHKKTTGTTTKIPIFRCNLLSRTQRLSQQMPLSWLAYKPFVRYE
jgi:hypothetical protein